VKITVRRENTIYNIYKIIYKEIRKEEKEKRKRK